jgi:hypothetical protein
MSDQAVSARRRGGFALVLALTVMSLLVLIILSLAGFLTIETRLAESGAQLMRARLNAIMAGRIALGHLQQEAGPDQRVTATGELAGVPPNAALPSPWVLGTAAAERLSQGRTRWTGVWRSDQPDQPPAWLISGKGRLNPSSAATAYLAQSTSLSGAADYLATQWAPWQSDYPLPFTGEPMATLVGNGSAGLDPGPDKIPGNADDIDLRIALPRVPFPGAQLGEVAGGFAYWVGDEGVKARVNLPEPRNLASRAPGNLEAVDALRAPSRPGTGLLTGLKSVEVADADALLALVRSDAQSVPNVPGYALADPDARLPSNRAMFHDHTYWSAGVLADSYRGGLRRDLSLAFEMDDREFDRSEYGNGLGEPSGLGHATELYTAWRNPANGALKSRRSWYPGFPGRADGGIGSPDPRPRMWVPIWEVNPDNPERNLGADGSRYKAWSPVFIREDEATNALKSHLAGLPNVTLDPLYNRPRRLVGPLWHLVRDYYRLYKDVGWTSNNPTLDARGFYPNTEQFIRGGYKPSPTVDEYSRYDLDNAFWSNGGTPGDGLDTYGGTPDPMGVLNGRKEFRYIPRAVRGAYMPTIHRLALIFSMKKVADGEDYTLKLFCTPVIVLHNPYNVRLRLKSAGVAEPDARSADAGARLSFTDLNGVSFYVRPHVDNDPRKPLAALNLAASPPTGYVGVRADNVFSVKSESNSNAENFTAILPSVTLEPGEMAVFSSREAVPANTLRSSSGTVAAVLRMERGFYITGGFHADFFVNRLLTTTGTPNGSSSPYTPRFLAPGVLPTQPNGGMVTTWMGYRDMYWHHWLYLSSGWKQSLAGDRVSPVGSDLGREEVIGTRKSNSRASYGLMVNIGSFGTSNGKDFFGDPGSPTQPITIGPMANLRDFSETGKPGAVIGVMDTRMRVADTARTTSYNRSALSWTAAQAAPTPAPNPVWLYSNPLAQTSTAPSQLTGGGTMPSIGAPSLRTQVMGGDELGLSGAATSWSNLLQIDAAQPNGGAALGGFSHGPQGLARAVSLEIPTTAPLSLGQLMHANVNVWDWFPYRTVGNSFPPLVTPVDKTWTHSTGAYKGGHTFPDMAWLMNHALWDGFYFSGAAPRLRASRSGDYNAVREQSTQEVLDAFAAGAQPLANPRMRLIQPTGQLRADEAFAAPGFHTPDGTGAPDGHRRLAGYLLNDGALNVNSLSVEAWVALLTSVREVGLGAGGPGTVRFPRVIGTDGQQAAARNIRDSSYWNGFVELNDTQVRALAEGIVDEVRARSRFHIRTERDQEYPPAARRFRGFPTTLDPGTPFLGLAEFVNRFLGPTKRAGAHISSGFSETRSLYITNIVANEVPNPAYPAAASANRWMFHSGALESAIARADKSLGSAGLATPPTGAAAIVAAVSHNWNYLVAGGKRSGMPPGSYMRNVEALNPETNDNRSHTGFGAPGCLFQGDLLQALGPALASRSDTFVIRAHGDGATLAEASSRPTSAVLELVVQRLPEYLDARDAPETRLSDASLRAVNRALGRRFKVVSARWLTPAAL